MMASNSSPLNKLTAAIVKLVLDRQLAHAVGLRSSERESLVNNDRKEHEVDTFLLQDLLHEIGVLRILNEVLERHSYLTSEATTSNFTPIVVM